MTYIMTNIMTNIMINVMTAWEKVHSHSGQLSNYNPRWELRPPDPHSSDRTRPWHIKLRPLHCKIAAQFPMVLTDYDPNATLAVHKKFPTRQKERRQIISKNATWFSVMPNLQAATSTWTQSILHGSLLETFAKRRGFPPPSGTTRRSIWLPSPQIH